MEPPHLAWIEPQLASRIIFWLGWLLIFLGVLKIALYLAGELKPSLWDKIKSPSLRRLLTGTGNRLLFGLGGLITALFGAGSIAIAVFIRHLDL